MKGGEGGRGEGRLIPEPWATFKKFTMYVYKIFFILFFFISHFDFYYFMRTHTGDS